MRRERELWKFDVTRHKRPMDAGYLKDCGFEFESDGQITWEEVAVQVVITRQALNTSEGQPVAIISVEAIAPELPNTMLVLWETEKGEQRRAVVTVKRAY